MRFITTSEIWKIFKLFFFKLLLSTKNCEDTHF